MYMHTHTGKAFSPPGLYAPHSHPPHRPPTPHICAQLWTHTIPSTRNWARARMYWLTCNTCTVSRAMCTVSRATHVLSHVQHMYCLTCNTCTVSRAMCTVSRATHVLAHVQHMYCLTSNVYCLTCNVYCLTCNLYCLTCNVYCLTCNTCTVSRAICTVSRATHVLSHVQHTLHFLRTLPHLLVFAIPVPAHHIVRPPHATTHSRRHGAAHTRRLASCTDLQTIRVGVQTKWAHTCWHKHTHKSSISLAS